MSRLFPSVDPDGLLEYSVVFNDRSLNHMSVPFQQVMRDISAALRQVYNAKAAVIVPGGGSFGMEAVARQFAHDEHCLVIRNGWFSYRWTQILQAGRITDSVTVLQAKPLDDSDQAAFAPVPAKEVAERIRAEKPAVVFAPHVETAAGIVLPDDYLKTIGDAVSDVNGLFVLDCVASGALWVDTTACGVDVLINAPQKGWSASPCAAMITLSERAMSRMKETTSSSFVADLRKWTQIMQAYESGSHAYHATVPTDTLVVLRDAMVETIETGLDLLCQRQEELGGRVRDLFSSAGFKSVAAPGFESSSVVVLYTDDINIHNTSLFREQGLQIASGVPMRCGEPDDFCTFRIGLFGLEKLNNVDRTVKNLEVALKAIQG